MGVTTKRNSQNNTGAKKKKEDKRCFDKRFNDLTKPCTLHQLFTYLSVKYWKLATPYLQTEEQKIFLSIIMRLFLIAIAPLYDYRTQLFHIMITLPFSLSTIHTTSVSTLWAHLSSCLFRQFTKHCLWLLSAQGFRRTTGGRGGKVTYSPSPKQGLLSHKGTDGITISVFVHLCALGESHVLPLGLLQLTRRSP